MGQIEDLSKILHEQEKAELGHLDFYRRLNRINKEDIAGDLSRNEHNRRMCALMQDVKSRIESFTEEHRVKWLAEYDEKECIFHLGQYIDSKDVPTDRYVLHDSKMWNDSFISGGYFSGDIHCNYDDLEVFELHSHPKKAEYLDAVVSAINTGILKYVEKVAAPNRLFGLSIIKSLDYERYDVLGQKIESYCPYNYSEDIVKEMMKKLLREVKTEARK